MRDKKAKGKKEKGGNCPYCGSSSCELGLSSFLTGKKSQRNLIAPTPLPPTPLPPEGGVKKGGEFKKGGVRKEGRFLNKRKFQHYER